MHSPHDETERLAILKRYSILDTPQEEVFDRIVWLAVHHFGTPVGVVSFMDAHRLWFKSTHGLNVRETERTVAFCDYTIRGDELFEIPDTGADPRFATNPLVIGDPHFRYYAGAPMVTSAGWKLGSVAVLDNRPRSAMSDGDRRFLRELAAMAVDQLEIRLAAGDVKAEIEQRRRAQAEAERSNLSKTKFLAAASHDLRQPMQSLMLFLGVLRRRLRGHNAATVAASAYAACESMKSLLDDLLDVSRLEAGLVRSQPVPSEIDGLCSRLAEEYRPRAAARGLELRHVCSRLTIITDLTLMERILRNLIENALRYTEHGAVLVGCRRRGDEVRVQVVDTGPGMSASEVAVIFDDFVQLANPERDRSKGLGLGLAIVRRLAALVGHRIEVRSTPGHGSTFSVVAPIAAQQPDIAGPHPTAPDELKGRMLVIDDERSVRDALGVTLADWGLDVVTAESAEDAVDHLGNQRPDAILADYRLRGGTTGVDAVNRLRDHYHTPIPSLLLTGDTSPDRLAEARSSGFTLLHKPCAAEELRRMIETVLPHA